MYVALRHGAGKDMSVLNTHSILTAAKVCIADRNENRSADGQCSACLCVENDDTARGRSHKVLCHAIRTSALFEAEQGSLETLQRFTGRHGGMDRCCDISSERWLLSG